MRAGLAPGASTPSASPEGKTGSPFWTGPEGSARSYARSSPAIGSVPTCGTERRGTLST